MSMKFIYNDGGRAKAGFRGSADDCVCRAITIASGLPYAKVYEALAEGNASQRRGKHDKGKRQRTARSGINTTRKWFKDYMASLGFHWVPTMHIGQGCKVHLKDGELPMGRLVVAVSKHYTAVINGEIYDTYDPQRGGQRCVYGYYIMEPPLDPYHFRCDKCHRVHEKSYRCIAQQAMGNEMVFTCDCGNVFTVPN